MKFDNYDSRQKKQIDTRSVIRKFISQLNFTQDSLNKGYGDRCQHRYVEYVTTNYEDALKDLKTVNANPEFFQKLKTIHDNFLRRNKFGFEDNQE